MNRESDFLEKLAEAYQAYDASFIEDYLADDMHYASMWVFHEMTSKKEYLDYLTNKLATLKKLNPNRSLGPISSGDVKVFSCSPESKECLALIHGSHKT